MQFGHKYRRLDALRGVAALSVGFGHAFLCVDFSRASPLQTAAVGIFNGNYAVDLFFVLSGFVLINMVRGFSAIHYAAYVARRFLRLYPILWASLIIAYLTHAFVVSRAFPCADLSSWACRLVTSPRTIGAAVRSALPLDYQLDPVSWTIKVEVVVSLVYPILLVMWMNGRTAGRLALAVALALMFVSGRWVLHFLLLFVAGIAVNDVRISEARYGNFAVGTGLALMAISGFFANGHSAAADLVAGTSATLLVASVAYSCPKWLAAALDARILQKLGEISYSYYLLNPIVLWVIARADARWISRLLVAGDDKRALLVASLLAVCAALASVLVAGAANRVIERPSIALSRAVEGRILRLLGNEQADVSVSTG